MEPEQVNTPFILFKGTDKHLIVILFIYTGVNQATKGIVSGPKDHALMGRL